MAHVSSTLVAAKCCLGGLHCTSPPFDTFGFFWIHSFVIDLMPLVRFVRFDLVEQSHKGFYICISQQAGKYERKYASAQQCSKLLRFCGHLSLNLVITNTETPRCEQACIMQ